MTQRASGEWSLGLGGRVALGITLVVGLYLARFDAITMFLYVCYAAVGGLLALRRPGNVIGWLLIAIAYGFVGTTTAPNLDARALRAGTASWSEFLLAWELSWSGYATFGGFLALMLLFPSGRLPAGRWHRPAIALLGGCVTVALLGALAPMISFNPDGQSSGILIPNRLALLPGLAAWTVVPLDSLIVPVVVFLAIGAGSLAIRYRRAAGIERLQLRWLVAAMTYLVLAIAIGLVTIAVFSEEIGGLAWIPAIVAFPSVPAAIYVAVTRYRLYEIDRIVSRTIGWVVVTAVLAAVFAVAIIGLQALLSPVTGNNTLAVAASTLLAASLFQPLRARVQRAVDRRFNRGRVDAQRVTDLFATSVRDNVDLAMLRDRLLAAVDGTVEPSGAALWIRSANR